MKRKNSCCKGSVLCAAAVAVWIATACSGKEPLAETPETEEAAVVEETETETGTEESEAELTIERILEMNGGDVTIHRNDEGRITFIGGTCTEQPVEGDGDAYLVLQSMLPLLGGGEDTEFEFYRALEDERGNIYYSFLQFYRNRSLPGGLIKVVADSDGAMVGLLSNIVTEYPEDYEADEIDPTGLTAIVLENSGYSAEELTVYEDLTEVVMLPFVLDPCMDLTDDTDDPSLESKRYVWVVYSDDPSDEAYPYLAHYISFSGEYLRSTPVAAPGDEAARCGFGASYVFDDMDAEEWNGTVTYADGREETITVPVMRDPESGIYYLGDLQRRVIVADAYDFMYRDYAETFYSSETNDDWDEYYLITYYNILKIWDYYHEIGWDGTDGEGTPILILTGICYEDGTPFDNAVYVGNVHGWESFAFADCNDFGMAYDVVAHEFAHGITTNTMTYNVYKNDMGAINEAYSDIMGNLCENSILPGYDPLWELGEEVNTTIRCMSDPLAYGQPRYVWDRYYMPKVEQPTNGNDRGGVHSNSSLLNLIAYRLYQESGMSEEEAADYWISVGKALLPYTDYPMMADLLPWVADINGMGEYREALEEYILDTRIAETDLPETLEKNTALVELVLPEDERYSDGYWVMALANLSPDQSGEGGEGGQEEEDEDAPESEYYTVYAAGEEDRVIRTVVTTGEVVYIYLLHLTPEMYPDYEMVYKGGTWEEFDPDLYDPYSDEDGHVTITEGTITLSSEGL